MRFLSGAPVATALLLTLVGCSNLDSSTQASDGNSVQVEADGVLVTDGEPTDTRGPRPYDWTDGEVFFLENYLVVFVTGRTPTEVLQELGTIRRDAGRVNVTEAFELNDEMTDLEAYDVLPIFSIDKVPGGVVVFSIYGFLDTDQVVALSRGGVAASFSSSINADYRVNVGRHGKVVREFDPLLGQSWDKNGPLPEERGLDLENDTSPASWTLLERLTSIHVTEDWLTEQRHPTYVLNED